MSPFMAKVWEIVRKAYPFCGEESWNERCENADNAQRVNELDLYALALYECFVEG